MRIKLGCLLVPAVIIGLVSPVLVSYGTVATEKITVDRKERTPSEYLVWSNEGEVYKVDDDWARLHFRASNTYWRLKEEQTFLVTTTGYRVPLFSWYPNIVDVEPAEQ